MSAQNKLNRRDFMKIGGLMAVSLPVVNVVGKVGDQVLVESEEEYGGFFIKTHETLPYEIDDAQYERPDLRRCLNPMLINQQIENQLTILEENRPGFTRFDAAFHNSAWTVNMALGTGGGATSDTGLFSWHRLEHAEGPGCPDYSKLPRWQPEDDGMTIEEVTRKVKRVAKFYGASLVGVAPLDERWFYGMSMNIDPLELLSGAGLEAEYEPIELGDDANGRDIVLHALLSMDKKEMKALFVHVAENIDPQYMPNGVSPTALKTTPAGMLQNLLPDVITMFPIEFLVASAKEIPQELLPDGFDPESLYEEDIEVLDMSESIPGRPIVFRDVEHSFTNNGDDGNPAEEVIGKHLKNVVVLAFEMDEEGINTEQSMIPEAAVAIEYSMMAFVASSLAQFFRDLGYEAVPMGNGTGLSVPMAIDAGLGELSRAGYLITPKYGPRVRLAKVATDFPLVPDKPISFGVTEFCEICGKCAKNCPSAAIPTGERSFENQGNGSDGVYRWTVNGTKCQQQWTDSGVSCSICLSTCPFTKPEGWLHDATKVLIGARSGTIDKILLKLDDASGYGGSHVNTPEEFWEKDSYSHIKD